MRVSIVTESFLPHINGVTNSVLRIIDHLASRGHEFHVVTPIPDPSDSQHGFPVNRVPSLPMPGYPEVAISLATRGRLTRVLRDFNPDVIHLASPFMIGPAACRAAEQIGRPVVAVFQTDVAGFAAQYGLGISASWIWRRLRAIHGRASTTLAPSLSTMEQLREHHVPRVSLWPRGVDADRFNPAHRDTSLRRQWGAENEVVVGFVGRLAPEKQVSDLGALANLPGTRLVVVGDGPSRRTLERQLPQAVFTGFLHDRALSRAVASFDIMVHTGAHETFCQAVQEALASGVPVVAPAVGGPLDLVDPSRTGWLYPPGDLLRMRDHVRDLAGDNFKRRAMGRAARESVLHRSWPVVMDQLEAHYLDVLNRFPAASEEMS